MSTKLAGVLVAVLLVATGATAAALPGSAPADADAGQATEHADGSDAADAHAENESAGGGSDAAADESNVGAENDSDASTAEHAQGANAPEHAGDRGPDAENRPNADRGPPVEMPDQVPDFVSEIHGLVGDFLSGDVTGDLGAAISDLTPGESQHGGEASSDGEEASSDGEEPSNHGAIAGAAPQGAGPA